MTNPIETSKTDLPPYPYIRACSIHMENETIGDGYFAAEIAKSLREYADMIEKNEAGFDAAEWFVSKGGTRVFLLAGAWSGQKIPKGKELPEDD